MESHGLTLATTDSGEGPVFEQFFEGYDRAFVLPDEKEDREGLATCLALNQGAGHAKLLARFGLFRELCVTAHDSGTGAFVGGANFIAVPHDAPDGKRTITANLNYIFITPEARGKGRFRALNGAVRDLIGSLFPISDGEPAARVLIFIEQNDPFRMSVEAYTHDTAYTGMDQFDRLRIWAKLGAKVVDFPYVQPALSVDQEADDTLVYSLLGADTEASLPADILRHHLERFFHISVLKGEEADRADEIANQLSALSALAAAGAEIGLIDPTTALASIKEPQMALRDIHVTSFRDYARAFS